MMINPKNLKINEKDIYILLLAAFLIVSMAIVAPQHVSAASKPPAPKTVTIKLANVSVNRKGQQCIYLVAEWTKCKGAKKYKVSYSGKNIVKGSFTVSENSCANNKPVIKTAAKGGDITIKVKAVNDAGSSKCQLPPLRC